MKRILGLLVFAMLSFFIIAAAEEPRQDKEADDAIIEALKTAQTQGRKSPEPATKWDMDHFDKTWGIKFKSGKLDPKECKVLLEFAKDLTGPELQALHQSLLTETAPKPILFVFFDEDSVSMGKSRAFQIEGDLSGKSGDAFRVLFSLASVDLKKVKKVSARLSISTTTRTFSR